ncbi:MAG: HAMP domain-containing protein, partial [Fimbriimonas ginsengisoli]|nr:HAMP domain-containing protein [Fimbriimonas ginsengisoli]
NETEIDRANTNVKAEAQSAASGSLIVTAAALVLALLLATLVVRLALKPLARVAEQAEALGAGHLDRRLDLRRTDEVGQLASAFNTMADRLQEHRKTEERRLRRAERMADMALEFLYDPVVVTDAIGRIVFLNHAAEGLFGPSPAAPRTPIVEHVGDRRIVTAIERAIKEDAVSAGEDEATLIPISVGGTERAYRLRATPMKDQEGAILGCVAVLEDITHLKELDRLKTEFIGVASHELRTPVTSLLLASQLLRERSAGPLTPMQEQIVNAQQEDLERLERLLQELLDITKLEAGSSPPRFALVAPAELVRQAVDTIKANAAEKGVMLKHEIGKALKTVRADPGQIVRVLVNLADNAVRHTPSGGSVTLRAMAKDDHVTFEVEDTGEGIHPDYLSRIFDRFVQVPGTTQGGAGLGLSIAQTILKAHGSEMRVTSELQKGSKFQFTLGSEAPAAGDTST